MTEAGFGSAPAPTSPPTPPTPAVQNGQSGFGGYADRAGDLADRFGDRAGEVADRLGDAVQHATAATGRFTEQVIDRLRNNAELTEDRGTTTIANEVVEKVAAIATREVEGVYDLGGDVARLFSAVREKIGLPGGSESADRGVHVRLEGKHAVVNITFVIEYGFVVYTVAQRVRANVISAVEKMLGLEVTEVNLLVDDVHVAEKQPGRSTTGAATGPTGGSATVPGAATPSATTATPTAISFAA
jgi:uncharacterized alkaline shock family protein YloU